MASSSSSMPDAAGMESRPTGYSRLTVGAGFHTCHRLHGEPGFRLITLGYNQSIMRKGFVERRGRIEELDRSFNLSFWQAQTPSVRFQAAWDLIVHVSKVKGIDVRQLRLQRSVEVFGKQSLNY
jgi:hypothetical protein